MVDMVVGDGEIERGVGVLTLKSQISSMPDRY